MEHKIAGASILVVVYYGPNNLPYILLGVFSDLPHPAAPPQQTNHHTNTTTIQGEKTQRKNGKSRGCGVTAVVGLNAGTNIIRKRRPVNSGKKHSVCLRHRGSRPRRRWPGRCDEDSTCAN